MTAAEERSLVDILFAARRDGTAVRHPSDPPGLAQALQLQLAVADRFASAGDAIGGWKIGMTSGSARDALGPGIRPFGFVRASRILKSGDVVALEAIYACQIEPELCLILGEPLRGPDIDRDEARGAIRNVAPAFEINEIRVAPRRDDDRSLLVADGLAQWGIVVGAEVPVPEDLSTSVSLWHEGELLGRYRSSDPDVLVDDPLLSLTRLCALLHEYGRGLEAGQKVITGSLCHVVPRGPGRWRAEFDRLGDVALVLR